MSRARLYLDQALSGSSELWLDGAPAHYLNTVLRVRVGDTLVLFNGDGFDYPAQIIALEKKRLCLQLAATPVSRLECESPLHLHLGLALTKGQKMDFAIQKLVELGVQAITPLTSSRSIVKLDAKRADDRQQHWHGIIIAACEQSGRACVPHLHPVQYLSDWAQDCDCNTKLLLDPRATQRISQLAVESHAHLNHNTTQTVALAIGPEGGFAQDEIDQLHQAGFTGVQLGPRILRAETAPLAAVAVLQAVLGDFR